MSTCILCDVIASSPDVPFRRLFQVEEAASEFLLDTENFVLIADVAPIVAGHCLVVSKCHAESIAAMSTEALDELADLITRVEGVLNSAYGPCCAFEHGSGYEPSSVACIAHAHMHLIPYKGDLHLLSHYIDSFIKVSGWHSLNAVPSGLGYLLTRSSDNEYWLSMRQDVERQHWRRVLASATDFGLYDWRLMNTFKRGRAISRERVARLREMFSADLALQRQPASWDKLLCEPLDLLLTLRSRLCGVPVRARSSLRPDTGDRARVR